MNKDPFDLPADVVLYFECGCRYFVTKESDSLDGLSCCATHEAPYQQLENILPLTLVKVTRHSKRKAHNVKDLK